MIFWTINTVLLLIIGFLLLLLSMFWPPDSPWAPWWRTNKKVARAMCRLGKVTDKDTIYELGSGDGTVLSVAVGEFKARGVGVEIDPLRYLFSKVRFTISGLNKKITLLKENFYDVNISKASVVFIYLVPRVLEKLKPKLLRELRPGTLILSYRYKINLSLFSYDKANDIYLYKIPGKP